MEQVINLYDYQSIIFDLGGVLLNIDYQKSKKAFEELGVHDFDAHFSQLSQSNLFDKFETGKISDTEFREEIKKESQITSSDRQIDHAWNAMLLDFPIHRIELLESLSKKLPLFLFSNTNEIHIKLFKTRLAELNLLHRFENAFQKIYYSFELGLRKPHPESFIHILKENNLNPSQTLFIDDSPQHIEGANKAGLQSKFLAPNLDVISLFENV
jgi:HAD superfamily hydrolase (TIGR01509 family)